MKLVGTKITKRETEGARRKRLLALPRSRARSRARLHALNMKKKRDFSRLQSLAWSFSCLERFSRKKKKKERLLVV